MRDGSGILRQPERPHKGPWLVWRPEPFRNRSKGSEWLLEASEETLTSARGACEGLWRAVSSVYPIIPTAGEGGMLPLDIGGRSLRVSTLEDIVAEKLRALLQQKGEICNRTRPQDLLDVAYPLRQGTPLNLDDVSRFLLTRAEARDVPASKRTFRDPELAHRANYQYDRLQDTVRVREDACAKTSCPSTRP